MLAHNYYVAILWNVFSNLYHFALSKHGVVITVKPIEPQFYHQLSLLL